MKVTYTRPAGVPPRPCGRPDKHEPHVWKYGVFKRWCNGKGDK